MFYSAEEIVANARAAWLFRVMHRCIFSKMQMCVKWTETHLHEGCFCCKKKKRWCPISFYWGLSASTSRLLIAYSVFWKSWGGRLSTEQLERKVAITCSFYDRTKSPRPPPHITVFQIKANRSCVWLASNISSMKYYILSLSCTNISKHLFYAAVSTRSITQGQ